MVLLKITTNFKILICGKQINNSIRIQILNQLVTTWTCYIMGIRIITVRRMVGMSSRKQFAKTIVKKVRYGRMRSSIILKDEIVLITKDINMILKEAIFHLFMKKSRMRKNQKVEGLRKN